MKDPNQNSKLHFKRAGLTIIAGGVSLVIEFVLIQLDLIKVELPDRKSDLPTILIAIVAWTLLFIGLNYLSKTSLFNKKRKAFYISLAGLAVYTIGCILLLFELWELMFVVPAGLLLTAIGMIILGIISIRLPLTTIYLRVALLSTGLYPFVCMFPVVAITGAPNYSVNYFWGFIWCFLGWVIYTRPVKSETVR